MNRWRAALGAGLLLVVCDGAPALAQYATTSTTAPTTTTTAPSTTTTTVEATTTTQAPPPATVSSTTSNPTPQPGESVPISTPATSNAPVLDSTKPAAAVLLPGGGGADVPMPTPKITQNANGSITVEVTVPPSTPPGVYVIAVIGTDSRGVSRAIIVPVVVRRRTAQSLSAASTPTAPVVPAVVPEEVRRIVTSVAKAGGATAVEDAVLHDGAVLRITNDQLVVFHPGEDTNDDSRPLVAAFAVALAGGGLVLLRRRTPAISKRSR
jgi:hypothetical protein